MKLASQGARAIALLLLPLATAIEIDCSMSETTRCDCMYAPGQILMGTDCRVCRIDKQLMCVLWYSSGNRYGPLCEPQKCPEGSSWEDGLKTPGGCYCDWQVKEHDRMPCPTPVCELNNYEYHRH